MSFRSGKMYTVHKLSPEHHFWPEVQTAVSRRAKPQAGPLVLEELYDVRWRTKPFPWSWSREFKPNRRFFYHGTSRQAILRILDEGFKIRPARHGRFLGDGIYASYHTNKSRAYCPEDYVLSVMVYVPNTLVVHPGQSLGEAEIRSAPQHCDAIEVRTGAVVKGRLVKNHEICIFDPQRAVPRFILRIA